MKFDFCIGNPPYHEESSGNKISDKQIYNYFMDAAYLISDKAMLITPARFLFDNGNTPKQWNQKMLNDEHLKVVYFEQDSTKIFPPPTSIKGGVAVTYRDKTQNFGAIVQYTPYLELNQIFQKVKSFNESSLITIIHNQNKFNLLTLYEDFPHLKNIISSDGKEKRLTSGCLGYDCFHDKKEDDDIEIIGVKNNKRLRRFINKKYLETDHENLNNYKVILPANNGSGAIGEVLSTPLIGEPLIGFTQTFISVGSFSNKIEAENAMKYIKTKFARVMLGILKITQNGKKDVWKYVPIQNFTKESDIDWSKSVSEIDKQLYKKYGLSQKEIDFIEQKVKEMT